MLTVSVKTLEGLDSKYGRGWICKPVIELLGGDWPLESGWRDRLVGNTVDITATALDEIATKESGHRDDADEGKKKGRRKLEQKPVVLKAATGPVVLTEEQNGIAEALCEKRKPVQTLGGLAGTGKTTVIAHLLQRLKGWAVCAFTGQAADVLRSKGVPATTIHSLIYIPTDEKDRNGDVVYMRKPSLDCKGIIVDEASMVGNILFNDLVRYGLPIIFVGDHGQLEPVGEDLNLMRNPDFKLETIHRNAGDIALFAHHLRNGGKATEFQATDKVKIIQKRDCVPFLTEVDQIICAYNATRVAINRYVRELKGANADNPEIGDRVISLKNSRNHGIFNGTQGVIRSVSPLRMSIAFNNGRQVKLKYDPANFNLEKPIKDGYLHPLDYAYAVTCHKAQGSEYGKVLVYEQICGAWDHRRWAYTAASRARDELVWILPS